MRRTLLVVCCSIFILGCEEGVLTETPPLHDVSAATKPKSSEANATMMTTACYDPTHPDCSSSPPVGDPCPGCAGIFLGAGFTWSSCTGQFINDGDFDGLDDYCENQLAISFRPMMSVNPYDQELGHEPYWAATQEDLSIKIMYMPAYYEDGGNSFDCNPAPPPFGSGVECDPHLGDNEFIVAYVNYSASDKHWILNHEFMSAHYGCTSIFVTCDFSADYPRLGPYYDAPLEFPLKHGWYSRVYVARDKHANYSQRASCNAGAVNATDSCVENYDAYRLQVLSYRNVGSWVQDFLDATASQSNPLTRPGTEWFWTDQPFCGWSVTSGGRGGCTPNSYGDFLLTFGF